MEKIYNNMKHSGLIGIIAGICTMIIGVLVLVTGILLMIHKKDVLF